MEELRSSRLFSLEGYCHRELFVDCTYVWEALSRLDEYCKSYKGSSQPLTIFKGVTFKNQDSIWIGEGATIEEGVYINGPCILGRHCQVRQGAYLRGSVVTGDHCVIGHAVEVKRSIFLDRAHAAHFNYVGDSILGNDVNLGAGFICSNYRLDEKPVKVHAARKRIVTGLLKLGAILGDGVQVGCNGVSNPGTILSKGCCSYPCVNFGGFFAENSVISKKVK